MGVVYKAEDVTLHRFVALKAVCPGSGSRPKTSRSCCATLARRESMCSTSKSHEMRNGRLRILPSLWVSE
jgi:hypothetical protein